MATEARAEINGLIDEAGLNRFNIGLTVFAFFVMLLDGYDVSSMAFAAPSIVKEWGLAGKGMMGPVFSASLVGMFFGAPLLGWVGDRSGRKLASTIACGIIGLSSIAVLFSHDLWQLIALRFVTGLGLGGLAPNMIALVTEYAPKRFRATMVICMYTGITLGGALVGVIAAWLVASHGWQTLFLIGGIGPLVMGALVATAMPESIKFLVTHHSREADARRLLARLTGRAFGPDTRLEIVEPGVAGAPQRVTSPAFLFRNGLAPATIALWLCKCAILMGYYFLMNWTPTLLEQAHVAAGKAALATSVFQVGGTVGGLVLSRMIDRQGVGTLVMLFGGAVPVVALVGYATASDVLLFAAMFLAGFCTLGIQFGLNAVASIIYPTYCRSYAIGWAFAIGRVGAIAGPIVGGLVVDLQVGIHTIFLIATIPFAIGVVASMMLDRAYSRMAEDREEMQLFGRRAHGTA